MMNEELPIYRIEPQEPPLWLRLLQWKYVFPVSMILFVIFAPFAVRTFMIVSIPDIGDPFDVDAFGTVNLPDAENARLDYEAAVALLVPKPTGAHLDVDTQIDVALEEGWNYVVPEIRQWEKDNRLALERWKIGTEKPDFLLLQPSEFKFDTDIELIQQLRMLNRVNRLQCSRLVEEGELDEAWEWCRAGLRCGVHVNQHGVLICRLIGIHLQEECMAIIRRLSEHSAASDELLRRILDEYGEIDQKNARLSVALKCEYLMIKSTFHDKQSMANIFPDAEQQRLLNAGMFLLHEPQLSQLIWQQYLANQLDQIDLPLKEQQKRTGHKRYGIFDRDPKKSYPSDHLTPAEIETMIRRSLLAQLLFPAFQQTHNRHLQFQTHQRAIQVGLALRIYHRRHGRYPSDPEELVTDNIMSEVPIDPSSRTGETLRYCVVGEDVFIWGVGENGVDDGGTDVESADYERRNIDIGLVLGRKKVDSVEAQKPYPDNQ
ncbi:MAG: hypothetical protein WD065_05195 [Planctomycetaceae bacterium]